MILIANKKNIKFAGDLFVNGEMVIYPTDTVYGIGVDATNSNSIKNLNKLKNRELPLSIIVSSFTMLEKYAIINNDIKKKVKELFPGPFTVLLDKKRSDLSKKITLNTGKIGIRIPDSKFIIDVVNYIRRPIVTTSVNSHGKKSLNDINLISKNFKNIYIFKNNRTKASKGSTIIDLTENKIKILRGGDGFFR